MIFGQVHTSWSWSVNPFSNCFDIWFCQDIVKYSILNLIFSSHVSTWISKHLGQSFENFGVLKLNDLWWRIECDGCPQILKSLLNTLGRFLMGELCDGEVNEIISGIHAIVDMIP